MKYFFLILISFLIHISTLTAQISHGTITYTMNVENLDTDLEQEQNKLSKDILDLVTKLKSSGALTKHYRLTYGAESFSFEEVASDKTEFGGESGGMKITLHANKNLEHYYTNLTQGQITNTMYIYDKAFLVNGPLEKLDWQLLNEVVEPSELTLGLDLKVASAINAKGDSLVAAYAPSLPIDAGPLNYCGLPGAILQLDIYREQSVISFLPENLEISPTPLDIPVPTDGKSVSSEKYWKIKAQKEKNKSGRGVTIMRSGGK